MRAIELLGLVLGHIVHAVGLNVASSGIPVEPNCHIRLEFAAV